MTIEYKLDEGALIPQRVHTVVISTQHSTDISLDLLRQELLEKVIKPTIPLG